MAGCPFESFVSWKADWPFMSDTLIIKGRLCSKRSIVLFIYNWLVSTDPGSCLFWVKDADLDTFFAAFWAALLHQMVVIYAPCASIYTGHTLSYPLQCKTDRSKCLQLREFVWDLRGLWTFKHAVHKKAQLRVYSRYKKLHNYSEDMLAYQDVNSGTVTMASVSIPRLYLFIIHEDM